MDYNELIVGGIGIVTTITSGWVSYFFTRKKYNTEVRSNEIENVRNMLNFYKDLSEDNKQRLHEALEENKELRREVDALREQNRSLQVQLNNLSNRIDRFQQSLCTDLMCQFRKNGDATTLENVPKPEKVKRNGKDKDRPSGPDSSN